MEQFAEEEFRRPTAIEILSQSLATLSHPAAIYWTDDLILLHNEAWKNASGGIDQQRTKQRNVLSTSAVTALHAVLGGSKATALQSHDLLMTTRRVEEYVLLSRISDLDTENTNGVVVQLIPKVDSARQLAKHSTQDEMQLRGPTSDSDSSNDIRENTLIFDIPGSARQFADMLPVGLVILNDNDVPVLWNQKFQELHPHRHGKYFGCWLQCIHADDRDRVNSAYHDALTARSSLRIEYREGSTQDNLWRLLFFKPIDNAYSCHIGIPGFGGYVCAVMDITPEKSAQFAETNSAREAEQRKREQEHFMDMISHEIRNPLSAILHCTEDIMEAVDVQEPNHIDPDAIIQATDTINMCIIHQKKVVDDVLSFSKMDASMLTLSPHCVRPRVELPMPLKIFRPELQKQRIDFEYRLDYSYFDFDIDWVMTDLTRISQVVINLFSNAIKFIAKKTGQRKIIFSMGASLERPPSYPPNVVFFESAESALRLNMTDSYEWGNGQVVYIMVAIRDTGIGISDEDQARLFERFNQATPRTEVDYGGSGIGLSVCRRLCHLHGGEIGVSSKEGQGSTFGFFFTTRRCTPSSDGEPDAEGQDMDELCNFIADLGYKSTGSSIQNEDSKIPIEPTVTSAPDVQPGAIDDSRSSHTAGIAFGTRHRGADQKPAARINTLKDDSGKMSEHEISGASEAKRTCVLLVEDNIINQRVISRKLSSAGFDVFEANNGNEAVEATKARRFDCILMDKQMPVMDGNAATRTIRQFQATDIAPVPIIGVTADARPEQHAEMKQAGMTRVVQKPYRTEELVSIITELTAKRE